MSQLPEYASKFLKAPLSPLFLVRYNHFSFLIPKPKIFKENERTSTKKMSDTVPKNTLKEQPGKELRIREKGTVVQLKECIKI